MIEFWSRSDPPFNQLSNFAAAPFVDGFGVPWSTMEHFHQAGKAQTPAELKAILEAPNAGAAKRLGSHLTPLPLEQRIERMAEGLAMRFTQHLPSVDLLGQTGNEKLVHVTPWGKNGDPLWGSGRDGSGQNLLGVMLMAIRGAIREGRDPHQAALQSALHKQVFGA